jgi:hypothetical protein
VTGALSGSMAITSAACNASAARRTLNGPIVDIFGTIGGTPYELTAFYGDPSDSNAPIQVTLAQKPGTGTGADGASQGWYTTSGVSLVPGASGSINTALSPFSNQSGVYTQTVHLNANVVCA